MKYKPKYLDDTSPQKKGRLREKKACQTINSGATFIEKGDLIVTETDEDYCVDTKDVSVQKVFQLSLKNIDKFYKQAIPKTPVIMIFMGDYIIRALIQKK